MNTRILTFGILLMAMLAALPTAVEAQRRDRDNDKDKEVNPTNGFMRVPDAERTLKIAEAKDQIIVFYQSVEKAGSEDKAKELKAPMTFSTYRNMARVLMYPSHDRPSEWQAAATKLKSVGGSPKKLFFVGPKGMPLGSFDPVGKRDEGKFMAEHVANLLKWWASATKDVNKLKKMVPVGKYSEALERAKEIEEEDRISTKMVLSEPMAIIEMMKAKKKKGEMTEGPQLFFDGLHDELFKMIEEDAKRRLAKAKQEVADGQFSKAKITLFRIIQKPVDGIPEIVEAQELYKEIEESLKKK